MTTLDCADPRRRRRALGFGRLEGYQPPPWPDPDGTKQFHFDLGCDDIAAGEVRAVGLGATVPHDQPGETWRVLPAPAGHPFSLTAAANW